MISVSMKPGRMALQRTLGAVLVGGVAHHLLEPGLGHRVRHRSRGGSAAGDRRHADEGAPPAATRWGRVLQAEQGADHVQVQHPGEGFQVLRWKGPMPPPPPALATQPFRYRWARRRWRRRVDVAFVGDVGDHVATDRRAGAVLDLLGRVHQPGSVRPQMVTPPRRRPAAPRTPARCRYRHRSRVRNRKRRGWCLRHASEASVTARER